VAWRHNGRRLVVPRARRCRRDCARVRPTRRNRRNGVVRRTALQRRRERGMQLLEVGALLVHARDRYGRNEVFHGGHVGLTDVKKRG
jgi:hypothetical protein